jgi:GTP-binding protein
MTKKVPSLVIVGRPNVGKSTLFNRLTGTRRAIVTNEPGITRDRIYGQVDWRGRSFEVVDTGGIVPDDKALIPQEIFRQARLAIDKAALLILVADGHAGVTPLDEELARLLRETGKPFFVAVNKVDAPQQEANAAAFHRFGAPVFPLTAEHGTGVDDLLDAALAELYPGSFIGAHAAPQPSSAGAQPVAPQLGTVSESQADSPFTRESASTEIAIIGRPNVGKSTLLNRLVGEERSIVSPTPGTTMDTVDTEIARDGHVYRFVDTAGIRRKGKTKLVAEKLSVVMARRGLERADVALLVVDSEEGVTQGDAQIASYAEESGRSVIIVMNKWDLAIEAATKAAESSGKGIDRNRDRGAPHTTPPSAKLRGSKSKSVHEERHSNRFREVLAPSSELGKSKLLFDYEKMVRGKLKFLSYAPIVFLSAKTGERAPKLYPLIDQVAAARKRRIPTPELNRWLKEDVDLQRGTTPKARPVRIYYITQAQTAPPTFLLFTNQQQPLHFSFERFLENQLRAKFDFSGTPVRFVQRLRKRGEKSSKDG